MRPRVFILQPVARSAIEHLRSTAEVEWNPDAVHIMTKDELRGAKPSEVFRFAFLYDSSTVF